MKKVAVLVVGGMRCHIARVWGWQDVMLLI